MSDIAGRIFPRAPTLRYVVLRHEGVEEPHYDLMFETSPGSALVTWRSPRWPIEVDTPLVRLKEHRREYLDYEGPVSGGRGEVRRIVGGYYRIERRDAGDTKWLLTFRDTMGFSQLEFRRDGGDQWVGGPYRG
jgi:hypothetical protein